VRATCRSGHLAVYLLVFTHAVRWILRINPLTPTVAIWVHLHVSTAGVKELTSELYETFVAVSQRVVFVTLKCEWVTPIRRLTVSAAIIQVQSCHHDLPTSGALTRSGLDLSASSGSHRTTSTISTFVKSRYTSKKVNIGFILYEMTQSIPYTGSDAEKPRDVLLSVALSLLNILTLIDVNHVTIQ